MLEQKKSEIRYERTEFDVFCITGGIALSVDTIYHQ